ncbi:hypothetical protein ACXPWS_16275 [Mycobacterium sp. BMJ-28]
MGKKKTGSKPVVLGGPTAQFARRDTGQKPAKRQTQKDHGTNRQGASPKR